MTDYPRKSLRELVENRAERMIRNFIGLKETPMPAQAKRQVMLFSDLDCLGSPHYEQVDDTHRIASARHRCEDRLPYVYLPQYYVRKADSWHYYYDHPYVLALGTRQAALDYFKEGLK